jgi:hypothetical protein
MDFRQKIDKLLSIKGIKLYKLAEISGLGNTLEKAYEKNRDMRQSTTDRFIQKLRINSEWWKTGKGDVFAENITDGEKTSDNTEIMDNEEFVRDLLYKKDGKYTLFPTAMLDGAVIISREELANMERRRNEEIANINKMWQEVVDSKKEVIALLQSKPVGVPAQKTQ